MMIVTELMRRHHDGYYSLTKAERTQVTEHMLEYAFSLMDVSEFNKRIRNLGGDRVLDLRQAMANSGRMTKAKVFLYRAHATNKVDRSFELAQLPEQDANLRKWVGKSEKLEEAFAQYREEGFRAISWNGLQNAITTHLPDVKKFASITTAKQLAFVVSAGQDQANHLVSELVTAAVQGAYRMYPRIHNKAHLKGIMLQSITRHGINLQKYFSYDSRKAMREEKDANGHTVYRNIVHKIDLMENDHPNLMTPDCSEDGLTLMQLVQRYKGRHRYYIELLTGKYDQSFSVWLNNYGVFEPNDDLFDRHLQNGSLDDYSLLAATYLGLPEGYEKFNIQLQHDVGGVF